MRSNAVARPCQHCKRLRKSFVRGLCYGCWQRPEIKDLYPVPEEGVGIVPPHHAPACYTNGLPGSYEKLVVLEARAAAGVHLWHPKDATGDEEPRPAAFYFIRTSQRRRGGDGCSRLVRAQELADVQFVDD